MFIVGEGIDRAGKSTTLKRLAAKIGERAMLIEIPDRTTPSGITIDRFLRGDLFVARDHLNNLNVTPKAEHDHAKVLQALIAVNKHEASWKITNAIRDGKVVIAVRWTPSAYAYGISDGCEEGWLYDIHRGVIEPDLCILFDVPVEVAFERGAGVEAYEKRERLTKAADTYQRIWRERRAAGNGNWVVIDATKSPDDVLAEVEAWYEARRVRSLDLR